MGESTCLMQPFSYVAGIPNEATKEGNPIHALGHSVSFGRFMSEPLQWEKWSTFSHNKYVEEAERFSRPGSVAQMKAFFEAHYRNLAARKAAALLEQANSAETNQKQPEPEVPVHEKTNQYSVIVNTDTTHEVDVDTEGVKMNELETILVADDGVCKPDAEMVKTVTTDMIKSQVIVDNCAEAESESQVTVVDDGDEVKELELSEDKQMEKPLLKDFISRKDDSVPPSKKKPAVFSARSVNSRTSKLQSTPVKPSASVRTRKETTATPTSRKSAIDMMDRKKQTPKSTHESMIFPPVREIKTPKSTHKSMIFPPAREIKTPKSTHKSMNFTPVREINRLTSTIMRKIDGSRVGSSSIASKDCTTPLRTATKLSMLKEHQYSLDTPQSEMRRAETPVHPAATGSKTVRSKWNFLPTDCSKFMSGHRNKPQSPNVTPFSFRTEERAARRKEKLEEKFNASQAQKVQLQTTLKKAEAELKKLRKSLCFKARPLPDFYQEISTSITPPKDPSEKVPLADHSHPKRERNNTSMSTSQFPRKSSVKKTCSKPVPEKNSQKSRSLAARLNTIISHENTSPNIRCE